MRFSVIESGTSAAIIRRDLLQLGRNLADMSPGLEDVGDIMREGVRKQFATEGAYGGAPWEQLADSTTRSRARELGLSVRGGALRDRAGRFASAAHPIMRVHDLLYHSLVRKFDPAHVESASADSLRFGTTVPYAVFHQSLAPRTQLPRRPLVTLSEADKRQVTRTLMQASLKGVRGGRGVGDA